ncbi:DUF4870 domain-containing protein [Saliterribacillus persicus]|uniref:Putative membrane protein n=1 Tax=Saliterribacillus persicus TaxID=930114 RepID=A0A368Y9Y6_9BACI|nr:DUF4870 domain-containing protein [Saliterribacillus persicus]RCW75004.1 putative membrane protein [Saliterribacillus persicus]
MTENKEKQDIEETGKTSSGMTENLAGALTYVLGFITGIIFLFIEKDNKFIRYHAFQSIIFWGGFVIVNFILGLIPFLGWILNGLMVPIGLAIWIYCMYQAYQGKEFEIPYVGKIAREQIAR